MIEIKHNGESFTITSTYPAYGVIIDGEGIDDNFLSISPNYPVEVSGTSIKGVKSIYDFLRK